MSHGGIDTYGLTEEFLDNCIAEHPVVGPSTKHDNYTSLGRGGVELGKEEQQCNITTEASEKYT